MIFGRIFLQGRIWKCCPGVTIESRFRPLTNAWNIYSFEFGHKCQRIYCTLERSVLTSATNVPINRKSLYLCPCTLRYVLTFNQGVLLAILTCIRSAGNPYFLNFFDLIVALSPKFCRKSVVFVKIYPAVRQRLLYYWPNSNKHAWTSY